MKISKNNLLNVISNTLLYREFSFNESSEDINKLICLFNNKYKRDIEFKIFFEKTMNGNPYYVRNKELNNCSRLIQELSSMELDAMRSGQAKDTIDLLYRKIIDENQKINHDNKIIELRKVFSDYELDSLFNNFMTNNIFILNFRGGNRNTLPHECELDVLMKVYRDINLDSIISIIDNMTIKYGAKYNIKGGRKYDCGKI